MSNIDFENLEEKFEKTLTTKQWKQFEKDFASSSDIYLVANGGLWGVANHAADDCTRLFAKAGIAKNVKTLDSQCLITSIANDYGYNNLFLSWLELQKKTGAMKKDAMIVALSCSGGSKNVVSCCPLSHNKIEERIQGKCYTHCTTLPHLFGYYLHLHTQSCNKNTKLKFGTHQTSK